MPRDNHEADVIARFQATTDRHGLASFKGQDIDNRVAPDGNVYFQFGDLRTDLPPFHLIVEVESSGGVTNLVKYWKCLTDGTIKKPVRLIHVFRQKSANDYGIHINLWHFLAERMCGELPNLFCARLFKFNPAHGTGLDPALTLFGEWIHEGQAQRSLGGDSGKAAASPERLKASVEQ